jgi:hypothetical protein
MSDMHPKLKRGRVWCTVCGRSQQVDAMDRLQSGWPECCGYTMTIDSPAKRKRLADGWHRYSTQELAAMPIDKLMEDQLGTWWRHISWRHAVTGYLIIGWETSTNIGWRYYSNSQLARRLLREVQHA